MRGGQSWWCLDSWRLIKFLSVFLLQGWNLGRHALLADGREGKDSKRLSGSGRRRLGKGKNGSGFIQCRFQVGVTLPLPLQTHVIGIVREGVDDVEVLMEEGEAIRNAGCCVFSVVLKNPRRKVGLRD